MLHRVTGGTRVPFIFSLGIINVGKPRKKDMSCLRTGKFRITCLKDKTLKPNSDFLTTNKVLLSLSVTQLLFYLKRHQLFF